MIEKKYKLTEDSIRFNGRTLYRIEATKDFSNVKNGDKGGFVESEENLSQSGNAWVGCNAKVYDNAKVHDNAVVCGSVIIYGHSDVCGNAMVFGNAIVSGNVCVTEKARVFDNAIVSGYAIISGNAEVCGWAYISSYADYIVFKNWWSSGRYFTWTKSNNMWKVGCFYGTGEELIAKAYKDSKLSGREYERVVKYVESILKD